MTRLIVQPGIMEIAPYIGGGSNIDGKSDIIKLSSNESSLGPSPRVHASLIDLKLLLHRYPDGDCVQLRQAIGNVHGVSPDLIVCGAGSDELISLICQAFAGPGDEVVYSEHGFLMYPISARSDGPTPIAAPESNLTTNVDALLAAVSDKTRILFLANPNNPTGTYISSQDLGRLHAELPPNVLLVVDAAYSEYVDRQDYDNGVNLVKRYENVVMTRTFSKIYGLGGIRLGWAYCSETVKNILHRVRGPFNVNSIAQAAGIAAVEDVAHTERVHNHNKKWLPWTINRLREFGLSATESIGNFVLCGFEHVPGADAMAANKFLKKNGIIVRRMDVYGLPNHLRITIGTEEEMAIVTNFIGDFLERERS